MTFTGLWNWILQLIKPKPTAAPKPPPSTIVPWGPPGSWQLVFEDTFAGPSVNTKWWSLNTWGTPGEPLGSVVCDVRTSTENVAIVNGELVLTLSAPDIGATIDTNPVDHYSTPGKVGFEAQVGSVCEARVWISLDNWCGWWTSGQDWPRNGEHDIIEVLGDPGQATVNYHSKSGSHNQGAVPGDWTGWHTYTLHRKRTSADVYWDGKLVKSYPTDDSGGAHSLILSMGAGLVGAQMRVDYVRVWNPV